MTVQELRKKGWIHFEGIGGSKAAGTDTPESDTDIRGVFVQPTEEVLRMDHIPQVSDKTNDVIFYEIGRFIELLMKGNPNVLELLNLPENCVIFCSEMFRKGVLYYQDIFLTKQLAKTFGGYAVGQIKKARGLNKKINQDKNKVVRKGVLDFCYVLKTKEESVSFKHWSNKLSGIPHEKVGLAKVNNFPDTYSMYFLETGGGIIDKFTESNEVQLRSIPKESDHIGYLRFDRNAYSTHCKDYREYQEWLEKRNPQRYKDNLTGEVGYDHKNMSQCFKLLNMAEEIALGKGVQVRRPEREFLLSIRKGEFKYDELLDMAEEKIKVVDKLFEESELRSKPPFEMAKSILLEIRLMNLS